MNKILLCAALFVHASGAAQAANNVDAAEQAVAAVAPALNADTPIEKLMGKAETKAVLLKYVPEIDGHPAYDAFKGMSVRQLQPLAGGLITDEKITALENDLRKVKS